MLQRLAIGLALPLSAVLVAAGLIDLPGAGGTGSNQEGTEITGDPLTCPNGSQVLSSFTLTGGNFHVVGEIIGAAEGNLVVQGPTGQVELTARADTQTEGTLVGGDIVEAEGVLTDTMDYVAERIAHACEKVADQSEGPADTATPEPSPDQGVTPEHPGQGRINCSEATKDALERLRELQAEGKPVDEAIAAIEACGTDDGPSEVNGAAEASDDDDDCSRGPGSSGDLRLKVEEGDVEIDRGALVQSSEDGKLTVDTPFGLVSVEVSADTKVKGDVQRATVIKLEGALSGEGSVQADELKVLCPDDHDDDDDDDDDDGDD